MIKKQYLERSYICSSPAMLDCFVRLWSCRNSTGWSEPRPRGSGIIMGSVVYETYLEKGGEASRHSGEKDKRDSDVLVCRSSSKFPTNPPPELSLEVGGAGSDPDCTGFGSNVPDEELKPSASFAKPIARGSARKTLYTFFRNDNPKVASDGKDATVENSTSTHPRRNSADVHVRRTNALILL
ncbi:hypothetical protein M405DRAFT_48478 [Rhizopogon salebrosus TDB-379]|nr:hypothetical protein M405DRAFT_48478 [Rhizopogon salebrosus TDB-379]